MKKALKNLASRLTRKNVRWLVKTNVQSWVLQGALAGGLTLGGVGTVAALVTAKVAAYVVFVGQCYSAAKAK